MARNPFSFSDIEQECEVIDSDYLLDGQNSLGIGLTIHVPPALMQRAPYNSSAYCFLQQLRQALREYGLIEFPNLPVNPMNHTLAQRAPQQHTYSSNPYLTDLCQQPHQDTPPYPTAFWLNENRKYFATWVISLEGFQQYGEFILENRDLDILGIHQHFVPHTLEKNIGLLVNQKPGLLLIDNSDYTSLYHARTCNFAALEKTSPPIIDTPMYAFNEIGLLNYIDSLDEHRGQEDRDEQDKADVIAFLAQEKRA